MLDQSISPTIAQPKTNPTPSLRNITTPSPTTDLTSATSNNPILLRTNPISNPIPNAPSPKKPIL